MTRAFAQLTAGRLLASSAIRFPDNVAFVCAATGRSPTFKDFERRVARLAQALIACSLRKGDVVAFLGSNRLETVEIYFALGVAGLVGLPLNYRSTSSDMGAAMRTANAKMLFCEAQFAERLGGAAGDLPVVSFGGAGRADPFETMIAGGSVEPVQTIVDEQDPFYFNMTSGTTGHPKSYLLSHYNNFTVSPFVQALDISRQDVVLTVFPMFGRVGFGWITVSIMLGIPNVLADFHPDHVLSLIQTHRVTLVNLVPTMAAMLLPVQKSNPRLLASLRAVVFAGAPLLSTLRADVADTVCRGIHEFYGMNEMGPLCVSTPQDRIKRPDSVGRPLVFSELKAIGDDGEPVGPGQVGELLGRSPMSAASYFGDAAGTAETFRDGWVHTGDLGSVDEDGYLTLRGRKKDMIVTGGQNVYAAEVENVLAGVPGLSEFAVIGLPDQLWGERVVAVLVADGTPPSEDQIAAHCRAHLAGYKVPKAFIFETDPLPRTPTAKVQKFKLVERLKQSALVDR